MDDEAGIGELVEAFVLGEPATLTSSQVTADAGTTLELGQQLWRLLGFPLAADDDVAYTEADADALRRSLRLMRMGVLTPERQSALVRTWGRSFARLAEWQVGLIADVAAESGEEDPAAMLALAVEVMAEVEQLQAHIWRRHLAASAVRLLTADDEAAHPLAVCFVDIVGFTARSKELSEAELVDWVEEFEAAVAGLVVDHGGRIIKNIGDEVLFVCDDAVTAARIALECARRGEDDDSSFPQVRAGVAFGEVVTRLGDVLGSTVNLSARLTSLARPGSVLVDTGAAEMLIEHQVDDAKAGVETEFRVRRLRRTSVKGFPHLQPWLLRPHQS